MAQYDNFENDDYMDGMKISKPSRPFVEEGGAAFLSNLDVPGRSPSALYLLGLVFTIVAASGVYLIKAGESDRVAFIPLVFILIVILVFWVLKKCAGAAPRNWLSPDILFVSAFCTFHFGYIVFYAFGVVPVSEEVFWSPAHLVRAMFFCICCLVSYLVGYEIIGARYHNKDCYPQLIPVSYILTSVSKIIILIAIIFNWGVLLSVDLGSLMTQYRQFVQIGSQKGGRFFWVAYQVGLVGVAMYCACSVMTHQKFMSGKIFPFITLAFIVVILLIGDRGTFLYFITIPVIAFHYFQRKIKIREIFIGLLLLFFVMGIIGVARKTVILDVRKMAQAYRQKKPQKYNIVTRTFMEFGESIKIVVVSMALVPEQYSYWYGKSYTNALEFILPNVIPGRVRESKGVLIWINELAFGDLKYTHGRGGSMAAESYLNFGFIGGALFFALIGAGGRILYERVLSRPTFVRIALFLAANAALILWIRNTINLTLRTPIWTILVAGAAKILLSPDVIQPDEYSEAGELDQISLYWGADK